MTAHPLAGFSTAAVSDALDRLRRPGSLLKDVLAGGSIAEARRSHGYHLLQRKGTAETKA